MNADMRDIIGYIEDKLRQASGCSFSDSMSWLGCREQRT